MAYHFNANQFEDKYAATKLGNWEYPKWYPDRPRQRFKSTKVIADDRGRLLEGIKRENPWGNYVGTWDLPRRITREYVQKLVAPPERLIKLWEKKKESKECKKARDKKAAKEEEKSEEEICYVCKMALAECNCEQLSRTKSSSSVLDVEKCGKPLTCGKCNNEICLCDVRCKCDSAP